jgi:aspartate dehydrogenase
MEISCYALLDGFRESPLKIAVIGFGAIGSFVIERFNTEPSVEVSAVFSLPRPELSSVHVVDNIESLLATRPELVVECAGHEGLRNFGEAVIHHGTDLLVVSVGALADAALERTLRNSKWRRAPADSWRRAGRIDTVSAAREAGLDSLEYSGRKPPKAWMGTPADK